MYVDLDSLENNLQDKILVLKRMRGPVDVNGKVAFASQVLDLKKFRGLVELEDYLLQFPIIALYQWDPSRETLRFGTLSSNQLTEILK